jgi:hypothetical protein
VFETHCGVTTETLDEFVNRRNLAKTSEETQSNSYSRRYMHAALQVCSLNLIYTIFAFSYYFTENTVLTSQI